MQKLMKALHRNEKGFTLVELMVVVVIIGILVAIAIPLYTGIQENAREKAHQANVRTLQGAAAMYITENGIPTADVVWSSAADTEFISEWPKDPWNAVPARNYTCTITATTGVVTVGSITGAP